jgi:UDP-N-acetylenolpyruvoylglucosamine reductase
LSSAAPDAVRATLAEMRALRHAVQPRGIKTFGSTFKNPPGETAGKLLAAAGAGGLRVGGARLSPKHANFVENVDGASTADIVALMARRASACSPTRGSRSSARSRRSGR